MFSKSKTKRFEEPVSSGPAVGQYNVKDLKDKTRAVCFEKGKRWKEGEKNISGYTSMDNLSSSDGFSFSKHLVPINQSTCVKKSLSKRKSCYVSSSASNIVRTLAIDDDEFRSDEIRNLQRRIKQLESEIETLNTLSEETRNRNIELKTSLDEILNQKLEREFDNQKLVESLKALKDEDLTRTEDMFKSFNQVELSVTNIFGETINKFNNLKKTFNEMQNDYQERLEQANSVLENTKMANHKFIAIFQTLERRFSTLQNDYDVLVGEHCIKENLIREQEEKLVVFTNNVNILNAQLKSKDDCCDSLTIKLVDANKESDNKHKLFSEEKENILKKIAGLESIHEKELKELNDKLLSSQNLNMEYSQQIENIELSMTENIRQISCKYECLEETFENAQKDYQEGLERSNSLVQKTILANKKSNEEFESLRNMYTELQHNFGELTIECETKEHMVVEKDLKLDEFENSVKLLVDQLNSLQRDKENDCTIFSKRMDDLNQEIKEKHDAFEVEKENLINELADVKSIQETVPSISQEELNQLQIKLAETESSAESWRMKYEDLERKVAPFMDQLEQFEFEKMSLLNQNSCTQQEMKKLSEKYGQILGHQNNKQKIRHISKLKDEHFKLKAEVLKLRSNAEKDKIKIGQLESKTQQGKTFDPSKSFCHGKENRDALKTVNL